MGCEPGTVASEKFKPIATSAGLWDPPYCPRRYLNEDPDHLGWIHWAQLAYRLGRDGNLDLVFRAGDPSWLALEVYGIFAQEAELLIAEVDHRRNMAIVQAAAMAAGGRPPRRRPAKLRRR